MTKHLKQYNQYLRRKRMAILLLLGVALHLSWELSAAEDEVRKLAEESAILRTQVEMLATRVDGLDGRQERATPD